MGKVIKFWKSKANKSLRCRILHDDGNGYGEFKLRASKSKVYITEIIYLDNHGQGIKDESIKDISRVKECDLQRLKNEWDRILAEGRLQDAEMKSRREARKK